MLIGLELTDFWNTVNAYVDNGENLRESRVKPGATLISIGAGDFYLKSNYQDFQRFQPVDVSIAGDAEATLPTLIEAVRSALPAERQDALAKRGATLRKAWEENRARTRLAATYGWDASPISTARLCAELWAQIKTEDWSLVSRDTFQSGCRIGYGRWSATIITSADRAAMAKATTHLRRSVRRSPTARSDASRSISRRTAI